MKKLFIICLLICAVAVIWSKLAAQTTTKNLKESGIVDDPGISLMPPTSWQFSRHGTTKEILRINSAQDTLIIFEPTTLKVIKIGEKYYNIVKHETTIEEDKSLHLQLWQTIPQNQWYGVPNGNNLILPMNVDTGGVLIQ